MGRLRRTFQLLLMSLFTFVVEGTQARYFLGYQSII
jgi:hypothetical protein